MNKIKTWLFAESYRRKGMLGGVVLAGAWLITIYVVDFFLETLVSDPFCLTYPLLFFATLPVACIYLWTGEPVSVFSYVWTLLTGLFLITNLYLCINGFKFSWWGEPVGYAISCSLFEIKWLLGVAIEIGLYKFCRRLFRRIPLALTNAASKTAFLRSASAGAVPVPVWILSLGICRFFPANSQTNFVAWVLLPILSGILSAFLLRSGGAPDRPGSVVPASVVFFAFLLCLAFSKEIYLAVHSSLFLFLTVFVSLGGMLILAHGKAVE